MVVPSPNSGFILLYFAHPFQVTILFDTGSGNNMNISEIAGQLGDQYCRCLLGLYFARVNTNCAFKGQGKVAPLQKLKNTLSPVFNDHVTTGMLTMNLSMNSRNSHVIIYVRVSEDVQH